MTEKEILNKALNIGKGWEVHPIGFKPEQKELRIHIRTEKGSLHTCGTCGKPCCRIYDHGKEREWRHMNFFSIVPF